ncbi:MAG: preprotein translocase subunit SecG [Caulobacteraceae bacterium]|nr:preprotein translocase subunit SecG [Caulobacteraceae bacterium]
MLLNILLGVIVVVCVALVVAILLQRSEGGALGMSGGGPGNFMTARGTGDFLTNLTQILAIVFFVLCLAMTLISGHNRAQSSIVDRLKLKVDPNSLNQPAAPAPSTSAPAAGGLAPSRPAAAAPVAPAPTSAPTPLNPFGQSATVAPSASKPAAKPAKTSGQ